MALRASERTRAQESRAAIQRLYIAMRHLFIRGSYKPLGVSGEAIIEALTQLRPEIYGSINDPERVELDGLLYVFQRLPRGIEECRYVKLISREGYEHSQFEPLVPPKRRRNAYRIDEEEMYIEMTRGRSDIYDILTHLTFMYMEAQKILRNSEDYKERKRREWKLLEEIVKREEVGEEFQREVALTYLSTLLGRSFDETKQACADFDDSNHVNSLFHITYWLGYWADQEEYQDNDREISFSTALREKIGHHIYGESWAINIKENLWKRGLFQRPIHIISANMHSVMNTIYAIDALAKTHKNLPLEDIAKELSLPRSKTMREKVSDHALLNGMVRLDDVSGTNISVQIIDSDKVNWKSLSKHIPINEDYIKKEKPVILVLDYAFGEQAFELMDELLKPYELEEEKHPIRVESISIMGKAGILKGTKGDIMIPYAHIFEGSADNYPFENDFTVKDFEGNGLGVYKGSMITVLGTSLQNKDILRYFLKSSWKAVGLEMEGAHFQNARQAASKSRQSIKADVIIR
jgi:hypothetical protein